MRIQAGARGAQADAGTSPRRTAYARNRELEQLLLEVLPAARRRAILEQITEAAVQGDLRASAFLFDRMYGRPLVLRELSVADAETDGASADGSETMDLNRLNETEIDTLDLLLGKAAGFERTSFLFEAHPAASGKPAVPEEPGGVRRRGAAGRFVGKAAGSDPGASEV